MALSTCEVPPSCPLSLLSPASSPRMLLPGSQNSYPWSSESSGRTTVTSERYMLPCFSFSAVRILLGHGHTKYRVPNNDATHSEDPLETLVVAQPCHLFSFYLYNSGWHLKVTHSSRKSEVLLLASIIKLSGRMRSLLFPVKTQDQVFLYRLPWPESQFSSD